MRVRLCIYLLMGLTCLVLASNAFLSAINPGSGAGLPLGEAPRARPRRPNDAEAQAFTERANRQLKFAGLWLLAGVSPFCAFGVECVRAYRARHASSG